MIHDFCKVIAMYAIWSGLFGCINHAIKKSQKAKMSRVRITLGQLALRIALTG